MTIVKKKVILRKVLLKQDEHVVLREEIEQLQHKLREKQNELFQLQRNSHKSKFIPSKKKTGNFVKPQNIIISNSKEHLKSSLELLSMLTGVEVTSYIVGEHCCVVFHMEQDTEHVLNHGLRIDLKGDKNVICKSSLPPGFNINAVIEDYNNIMKPDCLGAIRKALVAYYDRLDQFCALKRMLNIDAKLFKIMDGSHMEITFTVRSETDAEAKQSKIVIMLDYRVYDIRPKRFSFEGIDLPEGTADIIKEQCVVFKKKPLVKAFKEAFITGVGSYKLIRQMTDTETPQKRRHKRFRPNKHNYNNDDTFQPEDCSDQSDDDMEEN